MTDVKLLCKDCRHFVENGEKCGHLSAYIVDYVYGKDHQYGAQLQRTSFGENDCSKEAKFWEPKLKEVA